LFWLRAAVVDNIEEASRLLSISTHVITASLDSQNILSREKEQLALPPFTVERSVSNIEGIQSLVQPIASFNGMLEEKPAKFYTRIAERLKHKQRAITAWDYERLILEHFPDVYQVTCFPNMTSRNPDTPGNVMLVITPRGDKAPNPVEPMASNELLYEIKGFLKDYTSTFVNFEVRNPSFERVKIICSVKFNVGYSSGFYLQELNNQIVQFISGDPLTNQRLDLGGRIHISDILSFMRTFPYIDFITKFSMLQTAMDIRGNYVLIDTAHEGMEKDFLVASKSYAVLVPATNHQFNILDERQDEMPEQSGFADLEIGSDFIID
ncbi:MAG: baseplate J/gp47 family protein, partial [Bacteroidetes bacterium]|nr:baseplate J/gp47 family protein [Bacteroidota bacterium]